MGSRQLAWRVRHGARRSLHGENRGPGRQHRRSESGTRRSRSRGARSDEGRRRGEELMSNVPKVMKVIDVPQPGGPEALVIAERPVPQPGRGEVLIKVAVAGLNRADVLQRRGLYPD